LRRLKERGCCTLFPVNPGAVASAISSIAGWRATAVSAHFFGGLLLNDPAQLNLVTVIPAGSL